MKKARSVQRKRLNIIIVAILAFLMLGSVGYAIYRVNQNVEDKELSEQKLAEHTKASAEFDEVSKRVSILNKAIDEKTDQIESYLATKPDVGEELVLLEDLENSAAALADMKIAIPMKPQETELLVAEAEETKRRIKELDPSILDQALQGLEKEGYMPKEGSALHKTFASIDRQLEFAKKAVDAEKKRVEEEEKKRAAEEALEREKNAAIQSVYIRLVGRAFVGATDIEFVSNTNVMIYTFMGGRWNTVDATYNIYIVSGSASGGYDFSIQISGDAFARSNETGDWQLFSGDMSLKMYINASGALELLDIGPFRFTPTDKLLH